MDRPLFLTFKYRVKDASIRKRLNDYAWAVNQVWNFCCDTQHLAHRAWKSGCRRKWPTAFDLIKLCTGSSVLLGVHSDTIQCVCRQFVVGRDLRRKCPKFRASSGPRKALGWVPFIARSVRINGDRITYMKRDVRFWKSRDHAGHFKLGSFVQDARGHWYVCLECEVADVLPTGAGKIGIDLGLKALAVCSDGMVVPVMKAYRKYELELKKASRAKNNNRIRAIHAKIANVRRHHLHEWSTKIARANQLIVVGNIKSSQFSHTHLVKSVTDAGWPSFRFMLRYKARRHGARYLEIDEHMTTQTCSSCGSRDAPERPRGIAGLRVRRWDCSHCGVSHDRDVNAAKNILRAGMECHPPAVEIAA